jgi:chromate transporter
MMSSHSAPIALAMHLALLSCISFGGFPAVLPDLRNFVVAGNGWVTDQEFTNFFALAQAVPGPNMILLMSFIGWKVGGVPGAIASAVATFGPPCALYFAAYQLWDRFREAPWEMIVRRGLAPLTVGLVIAGGTVMARTGTGWQGAALTIAAAGVMIRTRINPLWILAGGGAFGGLGLL